jgi:hypothetical protein
MAKNAKLSKKEQLQLIVHDYMREHKTTEVDPDELTAWAINTGRMERDKSSFFRRCKKTLLKAIKDERVIDAQGREVPMMIGIRKKEQKSLWVTLLDALPKQVRVALSQQRRSMVAWCKRHSNTTGTYNDNNKFGAQVEPYDYNFNKDLREGMLPIEYPDDKPEDED